MDLEKYLSVVATHWAFFAVAFIIAVTGEVMKSLILGDKTKNFTGSGWRSVYAKTIPLHPVVVGGVLGLVLSAMVPEEISSGRIVASVLYFALSGALSSWIYSATKKIFPSVIQYIKSKFSGKKETEDKTEEEP